MVRETERRWAITQMQFPPLPPSQHWVGRRNSLASPFKIPLVLKQQEDAFSATGVWESEGVFSSISSHPTSKASPS